MIGFDIDDTIFNIKDVIRNYFLKEFDVDVNPRTKYFVTIPGLSDEQLLNHINNILIRHVDDFMPIGNSISTLNDIYHLIQVPIIFITARPETPEITDSTNYLLRKFLNIPFELYQCQVSEKKQMILKLKLQYFVDDRISVVKNVQSICNRTFLINQPWNIDRDVADVIRVNSISDTYPYIKDYYETKRLS